MFNIENEIAKANAQYLENCAAPAIDRDSVLYKSLMLKNQYLALDRHCPELFEERADRARQRRIEQDEPARRMKGE